ncbi:hypothetical protein FEM48_Zijuj06G0156400 [Ziziphus jujuba var. spinosa]|uniref:Uncharacterized protein n=1 Tax=Ziziphus jujuba var. spinosa TaxID=714518 RepID=A0A978VA54_ZIZJJ|nr:hypothetical protein FEM48_Zijuj06G0156400 [Ziziphus jujuba var. spinosa]
MARLVEEKKALPKKNIYISGVTPVVTQVKISFNTSVGILGVLPPIRTVANLPNQYVTNGCKSFTHEIWERRYKGLCFYCNEKFAPGHKCKKPQFFMIKDVDSDNGDDHDKLEVEFETKS